MNVIYLIRRARRRNGPVNQAFYILKGLNRIPNVNATLVTIAPEIVGRSWIERFRGEGIPVVQLGQSSLRVLKSVRMLKKYIDSHQVDIVHSSGFQADFINACLRRRVKTVTTQRCLPTEIVEHYHPILKPALEWFHLYIIKRLDRVVVCSKSLQSAFLKHGVACDVVQNCVDTEEFVPISLYDKIRIRQKYHLDKDLQILLVMGSLNIRKNVETIIDAFRLVPNDDLRLVVVGTGFYEEKLKERALGDGRIIFAGVTNSPIEYYQLSDMLVSASLAEGLPNVVLEALSCGLPCVLSDIEPHKEIMKGTRAGIIFQRKSVPELTEILSNIRKINLDEMKLSARNLAHSVFCVDLLSARYCAIYKDVLR